MSNELRCFDSASPWTAPRLEQCVQHGGIAVSVYVRGTPGGFRHASKADVALARKTGLGVVPNGEWTADFFAHCSIAEAKAAGLEVRQAAQACGFPDDGTITLPVSFDYQVPASGFKAALGRLEAVQEGCGDAFRISSYGQSTLISFFGHSGFGDRGHWLMGSTWQRSSNIAQPSTVYDIRSPFVAMVQMHDADGNWLTSPVAATDINTVTRPALLGAWWPDGSPYANPTHNSMQGADMFAFKCGRYFYVHYADGRISGHVAHDVAEKVAELTGRPIGSMAPAMLARFREIAAGAK